MPATLSGQHRFAGVARSYKSRWLLLVQRKRQANAVRFKAQAGIKGMGGFAAQAAGQRDLVAVPGAGAFDGFAHQRLANPQAARCFIHHHIFNNRRAGEVVRQVFNQVDGTGAEQFAIALGYQYYAACRQLAEAQGQQFGIATRFWRGQLLHQGCQGSSIGHAGCGAFCRGGAFLCIFV